MHHKLAKTKKADTPVHRTSTTETSLVTQTKILKWRPHSKCALKQVLKFSILINRTSQGMKRQDDTLPPEPLLCSRLSLFISLFVTLKSRYLAYKLIYKLHFSMNPFHCASGPSTLSSGPRIHLQMKPREVQPCPTERQDAFPLFTQHGSGGDRRHSLALLISVDSKQILFNSGIISLNVSPLRDIR